MARSVEEFFAHMDSPEYKAEIEAKRRAREDRGDAYFDGLGEFPIGRPTSRSSLIRIFDGQAAKAKPAAPDFSAITRAAVRKP